MRLYNEIRLSLNFRQFTVNSAVLADFPKEGEMSGNSQRVSDKFDPNLHVSEERVRAWKAPRPHKKPEPKKNNAGLILLVGAIIIAAIAAAGYYLIEHYK